MATKNLFSLPRTERFHAAREHEGERVLLIESNLRERRLAKEHRGKLLAVVTSQIGTGTELAVILEDGQAWAEAYSLATIFSIEELDS